MNDLLEMKSNGVVFNFNAEHNGIQCIESTRLEDKGTEHQFWFTRQMLREIFDVKSDNTITNHVEALVKRGVLTVVKNLTTVQITNSAGAVNKTTLYDLKVFNYLVMRLDTDRAWEMKEKFSDILSEVETTGSYGVAQKVLPNDYLTALKALVAAEEEKQRLALEAKFEKEQKELALNQRDEAIRMKSYISDKKTATALGRVGGLVKENNYLKETLGIAGGYRTILAVANKNHLMNQKYISWRKLKAYCLVHELDVKEIPDERYGSVKAYPVEAFNAVYPELEV